MTIELNAGRARLFRQLVGCGKSSTRVVFGPQPLTQPKPSGLGCAVCSHPSKGRLCIKTAFFIMLANLAPFKKNTCHMSYDSLHCNNDTGFQA